MVDKKHNSEPRISLQSLKVLRVFVDDPSDQKSGADIRAITGLASGTVYPILLRFEQAGWLQSEWEKVDPSEVQRPRKRLYRITPTGLSRASEEFDWLEGVIRA